MNPELTAAAEKAAYERGRRDALKWLPIESAPTDGTEVWVWGTIEVSPYSRPHIGCEDKHQAFMDNNGYWVATCLAGFIVAPTYWQPLPTPPQDNE